MRRWIVLLVAVAGTLAACSTTTRSASVTASPGPGVSTTTAPTTTQTTTAERVSATDTPETIPVACHAPPTPGFRLAWLPTDLPLPAGTIPVFDTTSDPAHHSGLLDIPLPPPSAAAFVADQWPRAGWRVRPAPTASTPLRYGYSRALQAGVANISPLDCDAGWSQMTVSFSQK